MQRNQRLFESKGVPIDVMLHVLLDTWIPVLSRVVDFWQSSTVVLWQVISWDVFVQLFHVVTVEKHLESKQNISLKNSTVVQEQATYSVLELLLDKRFEKRPHHVENERLLNEVHFSQPQRHCILNESQQAFCV